MTVPGATVGQYTFQQVPVSTPVGMGPNPAYAVPTPGHDWMESPSGSWTTHLHDVPGNTPDPSRMRSIARRDFRPEPEVPPDYFWSGVRGPGRERLYRHGVEFQDADGWMATLPAVHPQAPNPRNFPPAEPRPTSRLAPRTYTFTRPFGQETERWFNGNHFSMADHRRRYPILGMAPFVRRRNTYRADPPPWDADFVDAPSVVAPEAPGRIVAVDLPPSSSQSWRLG